MTQPVRPLDRGECLGKLAGQTVGRIAVTHQALPAIVPVNYALAGNTIVFRTEPGGMLERACQGTVVAFEVDDLAADGSGGWSVLVVGIAEPLDGSAVLRAMETGLTSAAGPGRNRFVGITIGEVSGRLTGLVRTSAA